MPHISLKNCKRLSIMYETRHLPNTRIDVADALRGIAVAGIILYHSVEHFKAQVTMFAT